MSIKDDFKGLEDEYEEKTGLKKTKLTRYLYYFLVFIFLYLGYIIGEAGYYSIMMGCFILGVLYAYIPTQIKNDYEINYIARRLFLIEKEKKK